MTKSAKTRRVLPGQTKSNLRVHHEEAPAKRVPFKKTPQYRNWMTVMTKAKTFPIEKHLEEVRKLHESRVSRTLIGGHFNANILMEANGQDISMRSRIVELRVQAYKMSALVGRTNEAMMAFASAEGHVQGTNATDRKLYSARLLAVGIRVENKLDTFINMLDDYKDDIDQSGWGLKRMSELIALASKPEYSL